MPTPATTPRHQLVLGDLRWWRRLDIHHLATDPRGLSGAVQRLRTPGTVIRGDLERLIRIIDHTPRRRHRPRLLPRFATDWPLDERFFAGCLSHGASEDGGRDDVEESRPKRRSSSTIRSACFAIRSVCSAITRRCCATTDSSSRTRASNRSTNASNDPESDTPRSSQATTSAPVATRHDHQPAEQLRRGLGVVEFVDDDDIELRQLLHCG